jgi:hypothetical protein
MPVQVVPGAYAPISQAIPMDGSNQYMNQYQAPATGQNTYQVQHQQAQNPPAQPQKPRERKKLKIIDPSTGVVLNEEEPQKPTDGIILK